ncbi:cation transporting ATPase C-terminal domain-containing protein [Psychromonas ingrahamii]|uniref:cation transporting ATPase C-terminal domain-containing protein n=1 Tax=Psychromonas ingrahamii TaxID=357794 RepID=UPI000A015EE1|nr:cation transporting ATPase C-terminal domain-containing protein [Psychromonas ingrahamii]
MDVTGSNSPRYFRCYQWTTLGGVLELLLIVTIVYTPGLQKIFSTTPIDISIWWVFIITLITLFAIQ